jgi:hypothetical protein
VLAAFEREGIMHIAIGTIAIIAGLAALGYGALSVFAGGMSDAPAAGAAAGRTGCIMLAAGVALLGFGVWMVL